MTVHSSRNTLPCLPPVNTLLSRPQLGAQLQRPLLLPSVGLLPPQGEPTTLAELEVIDGDKSGPTQLIPAKNQREGRREGEMGEGYQNPIELRRQFHEDQEQATSGSLSYEPHLKRDLLS